MEKHEHLETRKRRSKNTSVEPPPTYEESQSSSSHPAPDRTNIFSAIWRRGIPRRQPGTIASVSVTSVTPPLTSTSQPVQLRLPDPASILCHCGRQVDTTQPSPDLPKGSVRCRCDYVVSSDGSSRYQPAKLTCPAPGCAKKLEYQQSGLYACVCGFSFSTVTQTLSQIGPIDPQNVRCICGSYNDTTQLCTVRHKARDAGTSYEYAINCDLAGWRMLTASLGTPSLNVVSGAYVVGRCTRMDQPKLATLMTAVNEFLNKGFCEATAHSRVTLSNSSLAFILIPIMLTHCAASYWPYSTLTMSVKPPK